MMENGTLYSDIPSETNECDCCDECGQAFPIKSEDNVSSDNQNENNDSQDEDTGNSPEKKHECDLCGKKFITSVAVLFHKRVSHGANSTNSDSCNREFSTSTELEICTRFHITDNDSVNPINENSCNREYPNANEIETFTRLHDTQATQHNEFPRKCNVCDREISDAIDLEIHKVYHNTQNNDNSLRCKSCKKLFSNATELKLHKIYHDAIDTMDFNAVNPKPSGRRNITSHEFNTDENVTDHNSCEFSGQTNVINHQSRTDENSIQNNSLDKTFATSTNLTGSERPRISKTPIKCFCCDPAPIKRTRLRRQRRRHNQRGRGSRDSTLTNLTDEEIFNKCISGENPGQCGICHKMFAAQGYLKVHAGHHMKQRPFPCDSCNKSFLCMPHLDEHKRIHTGEKPYKCNVCDKRFSVKGNLKKHELVHTGLKLYSCDICSSSFSTLHTLERHLIHTHKRNMTKICKVCNQTFKRSCHLAKHQRKHTKRDTESSLVCTAPTHQTTDAHGVAEKGRTDNAIAHTNSSQPCAASTLQVADMPTESRPTYSERLGKCRQSNRRGCNSRGKTDDEIYNKCLSAENPAQCGICHKTFSGRYYLQIHVGSHTKERPFPCDICNKSFLQMHHLNEHERVHTGEKPYKCNFCDKRFSVKGNKTKHEVTHTGLKLYPCDICNRSFARIFGLERHLKRKHKRNITKMCKICNQSYNKSCHRANHQRQHTGRKDNKSNLNAVPNPQDAAVEKQTETRMEGSTRAQTESNQSCTTLSIAGTHRLTDNGLTNNTKTCTDSSMVCSASSPQVCDLHKPAESGITDGVRAHNESSLHTVQTLQVANVLRRPTESRTTDNVRAYSESNLNAVPTLQVANVLHRPTESKTTDNVRAYRESSLNAVPTLQVANVFHGTRECQTRELSSNCNNTVETSPTRNVADVQRLTEERITDNRTTVTPSTCQRTEALSASYSENSNTQHHDDQQFIEFTSCDQVDDDKLYHELEATEPTGMTYICFTCDAEFELPWQLLKHVANVHTD
jgi:KRAB domain-containing zinc finger protein